MTKAGPLGRLDRPVSRTACLPVRSHVPAAQPSPPPVLYILAAAGIYSATPRMRPLTSLLLLFVAIGASAQAVAPIPAFTKEARILFQGDSITDGNRGRSPDPNHILGHGYVFIIAARHGAAFPEAKLDFYNRGVSGNTVRELQKRWPKDTLELKPDLLSIMIGVNDYSHKVPLAEYAATYELLLTSARTANPQLKLILCAPFVKHKDGPVPADVVARQQVVAQLATKFGAALVDFQKIFDEANSKAPADYWIWDGVHPTYRGHQLMADEWERVVRNTWQ